MHKKIFRCATIGASLNTFCYGVLQEMQKQGYEVIALSSPDNNLSLLGEREGVRIIGVPMERRISLTNDLKSLFMLLKVFLKEKPDMVHSMTPKAGLLCMIASWLARVPLRVHTFTGLVWPTSTGLQRKILMLTDKITCACATHVIPEGLGVLNDLKNYKITKKPMRVLGYGNIRGVDMLKCSRRVEVMQTAESIRRPDCFTFVYVGRIVGDKGINELVHAFLYLIEQNKEKFGNNARQCRLLLIGPYEDKLDPIAFETRQMIERTPEIQAVGPKFGDDLLAHYAAADCFVFPSYREGFPNTVLEAGAMELASIVTDINGSREIICKTDDLSASNYELQITDYAPHLAIRENGVVIPSKDADSLYEAMVWIMEHEEERLQMGKRAREIVSERWEQGFVREKLYEFYREVLKSEE